MVQNTNTDSVDYFVENGIKIDDIQSDDAEQQVLLQRGSENKFALPGMIVPGSRAVQLLLGTPRLAPGRHFFMAACRSPDMAVPAASGVPTDCQHLASPSSENLLLFSESPMRQWSGRGIATNAGADEPPAAPAIVLTPAEVPVAAEPEREATPQRSEAAAPPQSAMVMYLRKALRDLVEARNEAKAPHTVEVLTRHVVVAYSEAAPADHQHFFRILADEHGVDHAKVASAASELSGMQEGAQQLKREEALAALLQPDYVWIFKQLGRTEGGVKFLVDMRAHLLRVLSATDASDPAAALLRSLGSALKELIALWFSVGFLQLERITWQSPCGMLEKVSEYEAVHPVRNWTDLKRRVGPYRRCFVFTHNAMPSEPVVVLHTALTPDISSSIQDIVRKPRRFSWEPETLAIDIHTAAGTQQNSTPLDGDLYVARSTAEMGQQCPWSRAAAQYNELPPDLPPLPAPTFQSALKHHPPSGSQALYYYFSASALSPAAR
ncbi:malonyl-CoA decarboxylase, mitochondrial-like isoform X4 [Pollicipes pollicipes]|uniref:malonyl-CoA decarboxylase, mitochondrial-like isoform X4 n=1 Tax=Pollicipes pollicipes TaxID=41117 RepID=UPI0018850477|nr:malonyl-CoA decarboxylase, mitochondrial-like isoform X4 [Pollicipes pollicipes]